METTELEKHLDLAVADAHLPALLVALAHLTGNPGLLKETWRPKYAPYADNRAGGLSEDSQSALRSALKAALRDVFQRGPSRKPPPLSDETMRLLMNFVAGANVPERYLPLLRDELGIDKQSGAAAPNSETQIALSRLNVVVIGGGMSGILAAMRLKQCQIPFVLVERNDDVGGTWFENTYPGCRVDSQNHIYSYSMAPNHDWPQHFSTQTVLLAYFKDCVERFGLRDHIRLRTSVEEAEFDEPTAKWHVRVKGPDGVYETIVADALISAVGQLNKPKIPEIEGGNSFAGIQFHSSRWQHDVDLRGKNVAVIGTGASAFQLAPFVAEQARHLDIYQRSAPWMAPSPDYHFDVGEGQKWLLNNLPGYASWYRFWLFWTITDGVYEAIKVDPAWKAEDGSISAANKTIREALVARMTAQIGERTDLVEKVIPNYPFGGKRTLRDPGMWIPMLKRDNVLLVTETVTRITPDAIVTADGREHPTDVIIYGTGFHASRFLEPLRIKGRGGVELTQRWSGDARAYLGMTVPGYPNFFMIYGPNTNLVVNGSIVFFSECSMTYIMGCLALIARENAAVEPRSDVYARYNAKIDAGNGQMAWGMPGVHNWYKNAQGRVTQNWPFPLADYWDATRAPNPDDFEFILPRA